MENKQVIPTQEEKEKALSLAGDAIRKTFADPNATGPQKLHAVSEYLYHHAVENASFLAEMMISHGGLTSETRAFESRMNYDMEISMWNTMNIFRDIGRAILDEFPDEGYESPDGVHRSMTTIGKKMVKSADTLTEIVDKLKQVRLAKKGWGTFIDEKGRISTVIDPDDVERVKKYIEDMGYTFDEVMTT